MMRLSMGGILLIYVCFSSTNAHSRTVAKDLYKGRYEALTKKITAIFKEIIPGVYNGMPAETILRRAESLVRNAPKSNDPILTSITQINLQYLRPPLSEDQKGQWYSKTLNLWEQFINLYHKAQFTLHTLTVHEHALTEGDDTIDVGM